MHAMENKAKQLLQIHIKLQSKEKIKRLWLHTASTNGPWETKTFSELMKSVQDKLISLKDNAKVFVIAGIS